MKNNYPIKYATIPMYESVGWVSGVNELERRYDVVSYIVSKCYVLGETKKYSSDGSFKINYEVVFPYEKDSYQNQWIRIEPNFDCNGKCIDSIIVDTLYDNYTDALAQAQLKNEQILIAKLSMVSYLKDENTVKSEVNEIEKEHNTILNKYHELETQIMNYTCDMCLDEKSKEQSIIVMFEDEDKVLNMSIYNFINLYIDIPFYVCNVSKEEYEVMKKQIKTEKLLAERVGGRIKPNYNTLRYLMANDIEDKIIRIADCNSNIEKGCFYLKDRQMHYDREMYTFYKDPAFRKRHGMIKVYTMETYGDIIKSYIPHYISQSDDIQIEVDGAIISKRLLLRRK